MNECMRERKKKKTLYKYLVIYACGSLEIAQRPHCLNEKRSGAQERNCLLYFRTNVVSYIHISSNHCLFKIK